MWMPKWYKEHKEKKEKQAEEEYQRRKEEKNGRIIYQLRFQDPKTNLTYSCILPHNREFNVGLDDELKEMNLIKIDLFYLREPFPEKNYFRYFLDPSDQKEVSSEDNSV